MKTEDKIIDNKKKRRYVLSTIYSYVDGIVEEHFKIEDILDYIDEIDRNIYNLNIDKLTSIITYLKGNDYVRKYQTSEFYYLTTIGCDEYEQDFPNLFPKNRDNKGEDMLTSIKATIKRLIDEGNGFTYENFSEKGPRGYPSVIKSEYEAWYLKVASFFHENFDDNHPLRIEYDATSTGMLLGNGPQYFEQTQSEIIGALTAALDVNYKPNNTDVPTRYDPKKVFIVHGHDNKLKEELNSFLLSLKLQPIILHRQADEGQTVIEKFEKHSNVGYSFILLTPDDLSKERRLFGKKKFRARQNVIFEFGFFVGKLERKRVCCLYKEGVELPTDVSGMIYKPVKSDIESVGLAIIRDLRAAGYSVDVPE